VTDLLARLKEALADRYRIERELGAGGMATVYLAHDMRHDRKVALKVLRPELAATVGPERFQREIRLSAGLQHPHILTVYDSGDAEGQLWFTMPYVEGESLRDRLAREKQLPVEEALRITREAAVALAYAHQHDVIHRDIKPENILLTEDGSTLVADFGIARTIQGGTERLTETGLTVGTPLYMSPEQAAGERELDARSDVYALGCVLYEMLAGEPPFQGSTPQVVLARVMTETPRPIHPLRHGVSPTLDAVVARAIARTPADRYPSMTAFGQALVSAAEPPIGALTPPWPRPAEAASSRVGPLSATHRRSLFAGLALILVIGAGALYAWRRTGTRGESSGLKLLAVLPFENLGASEDAYFADGIADEVRGKLTTLPGLQVTARGSSEQYKKTTKSPAQIGQELGVQYLLTGTVRWEKGPGGVSRVHVSPELVQASSGALKWQAPFDAALTDVFQVQADIAGRVAQALDLALADSSRRELAAKPTQNLAAWDAFLRGEAASQGLGNTDLASLRAAISAYEQAVALDPVFIEAWTQLSRAHSLLYFSGTPTPAEAEAARRAADRAAALAPASPETHQAYGDYYTSVLADPRRALEEDSAAVAQAPGRADLLTSLGSAEYHTGRWEAARAHLEQAARLDPRGVLVARRLGFVLLCMRRYSEARLVNDRALALAPTNLTILEQRVGVELAQGNLAGAQAVLRAAPNEIEPTRLVAFLATFQDLMWVLDDDQQALLLRLRPAAFDNDTATWGIVRAQTLALQGQRAQARVYADSAQREQEKQLRAAPNDAQRYVFHGLALAYLGRKQDAIREGERGVALVPISRDPSYGAYYQHQLVRIYILVGEPEKAVALLEPLLKIPYILSPGWLRIDPNFDPLRDNPRFQKLVAGS
jgi:serine/threonine protein kinase/tetratricopeptide (TPR) repeat protein